MTARAGGRPRVRRRQRLGWTVTTLLALLLVSPGLEARQAQETETPAGEVAPRLDPSKTWAVVAGVLEWADPGFSSFSKRNRKDRELYETLAHAGVPEAQRVLLLDGEATADAITRALERAIARAGPEDTLLFYFAGHGIQGQEGRIIFASSDARQGDRASGLHLDALPGLFIERFKGRRVILTADCCYSGGLARVAEALSKAGIPSASLTSAEASNISTGNWTFTQALIDGLAGRPLCDRDGDGVVTLGEVAAEVREVMKHREAQRAGWATFGVEPGLVMSRRRSQERALIRAAHEGDPAWVVVSHEGHQRPARVLGRKGPETLVVEIYDYSESVRLTIPAATADVLEFPTFPVGALLNVSWEGQVYPARVLAVDDGFHRITYPGWSSAWDEWVAANRIVGLHASGDEARRLVKVEWRGRWWDAAVTDERGGLICITYIGYDPSWDECVPPTRVRDP